MNATAPTALSSGSPPSDSNVAPLAPGAGEPVRATMSIAVGGPAQIACLFVSVTAPCISPVNATRPSLRVGVNRIPVNNAPGPAPGAGSPNRSTSTRPPGGPAQVPLSTGVPLFNEAEKATDPPESTGGGSWAKPPSGP